MTLKFAAKLLTTFYDATHRLTKKMKRFLLLLFCIALVANLKAQQRDEGRIQHVQKRYNIFFRINSPVIDRTFQNNDYILNKMKQDIDATLEVDGVLPDSLLILSTASPDGSYSFNRWLAAARAKSTKDYLLKMFPQFEDAHIEVKYLEEDWDGLRQVLKTDLNFPQREEMLAVLDYDSKVDDKEKALRALKKGWRYLVNNHIYALRNSSITLCLVMGEPDEFQRYIPVEPAPATIEHVPEFTSPFVFNPEPRPYAQPIDLEWQKMIMAVRTNFIAPGQNIGIEIPIKENWSIVMEHWYPWFVSKNNRWCTEQMAWFLEGRYWLPGEKYAWTDTQKLMGHAFGVYLAGGYYDYQVKTHGKQGEYFNVGVDYTFSLPIAQHRLRLEFNIGIGFIYNQYRPYKPSSDFEDLIKDPGIKYKTSNFFGPTRGGVSLIVPIMAKYRNYDFTGIKIGGERL